MYSYLQKCELAITQTWYVTTCIAFIGSQTISHNEFYWKASSTLVLKPSGVGQKSPFGALCCICWGGTVIEFTFCDGWLVSEGWLAKNDVPRVLK